MSLFSQLSKSNNSKIEFYLVQLWKNNFCYVVLCIHRFVPNRLNKMYVFTFYLARHCFFHVVHNNQILQYIIKH